ncbi:SRPBCC family protein [Rubrivirga sp. IMCC43871]|uniref:SRPBCC family protein n=1 Tax=Rubrivirga sp. IMCC43871 TaxID=3391575 RepID=UPI00398FD5E8
MAKPLTHLTAVHVYDAPPETVWAAVAGGFGDVASYNPAIERSEWVGDQRQGVGTTRRCHVAPKGTLTERITDWEAGRSFALEVIATTLPMHAVESRFTFVADGDGTRLTQDFGYRMKGLLGPFSGLMRGRMQRTLDTGLDGLAASLADR